MAFLAAIYIVLNEAPEGQDSNKASPPQALARRTTSQYVLLKTVSRLSFQLNNVYCIYSESASPAALLSAILRYFSVYFNGLIYTFFVEVLPFVTRPSHRGRYLICLYIEAEFLGELCVYSFKTRH